MTTTTHGAATGACGRTVRHTTAPNAMKASIAITTPAHAS